MRYWTLICDRTKSLKRQLAFCVLAIGVTACASDTTPGAQIYVEQNAGYDVTIAHYSRLHQENPRDIQVLLGLSHSLRLAGRGEDAVAVLMPARETFGTDADYLTELGKANLVAGKAGAARQALSNAVERDRNNWQAYSALGVANDLERRHSEASDAYNNALTLCPDSATILNNLALSNGYTGDVSRAIDLLTTAAYIQPSSLRIKRNLATVRDIKTRCPNCEPEKYAQLVSTIYPQDWIIAADGQFCRSTYVTAEQIENADNVVSVEEIASELNRNDFIDMRVHFAFDSAELTPEANGALDQLAGAMTSDTLSDYNFLLEGHTDAVGSDEYNQDLSTRRAASVKIYLIETHGIDSSQLESVGFGESRLADPDNPTSGINRRVRVVKTERVPDQSIAGL